MAQRTASTTLRNSTMALSPVELQAGSIDAYSLSEGFGAKRQIIGAQ
jgi:hypothetical protein